MLTKDEIDRFGRRVSVALTNRHYDLAHRIIDLAEQEAGDAGHVTVDSPLGSTGLQAKVIGHLEQSGVRTIADVLALSPDELLRVPGIGVQTAAEIIAAARVATLV